jgi:hypothetical protein
MLERIALHENLAEWQPSHKNRPRQSGRQAQDRLRVLTTRFQNALKKSVEGIIEAGRVLIEAKNDLEHGQFIDWVVNDLRFGLRKDGSRVADLRKAQILMFLARNEVISNACHWHAFPPSPRTLRELNEARTLAKGASEYIVNKLAFRARLRLEIANQHRLAFRAADGL